MPRTKSFMKSLTILLAATLLLLVACNSDDATGSSLPDIQGPALVMFYTDN